MNKYQKVIEEYEELLDTCAKYLEEKGMCKTAWKYINNVMFYEGKGHLKNPVYYPHIKVMLQDGESYDISCDDLENFVMEYK